MNRSFWALSQDSGRSLRWAKGVLPHRGKLKTLIPKANVVVMVCAPEADGNVHRIDQAYFDQVKQLVRDGGGVFCLHGERYADACASSVASRA